MEPNHGEVVRISILDRRDQPHHRRLRDAGPHRAHGHRAARRCILSEQPRCVSDSAGTGEGLPAFSVRGQLTVVADGFTTVLGLAFRSRRGWLYVLESSSVAGFPTPGTGRVIRVDQQGNRVVVVRWPLPADRAPVRSRWSAVHLQQGIRSASAGRDSSGQRPELTPTNSGRLKPGRPASARVTPGSPSHRRCAPKGQALPMRSHFERSPAASARLSRHRPPRRVHCRGTNGHPRGPAIPWMSHRPTRSPCVIGRVTSGSVIAIPRSQLAMDLRQGDYVTTLVVGHTAADPNDSVHFRRIGDAIAAARAGTAGAGRTPSRRPAGSPSTSQRDAFRGSGHPGTDPSLEHWPLTVDVPDLTLHGAFVMQLDSHGRATGVRRRATRDDARTDRSAGLYDTGADYARSCWPSAIRRLGRQRPRRRRIRDAVGVCLTAAGAVTESSRAGSPVSTVRGNLDSSGDSALLSTSARPALRWNRIPSLAPACVTCAWRVQGSTRSPVISLQAGALEGIQITPAVVLPVPRGVEPDFPPCHDRCLWRHRKQ